jgi:hypothetical protein
MRSHSDESPPGTNSCHAVREMRTGWELALFCESCMIELPIISILIRASSRTKERGNVYNDLLPEGEGGPHSVTCYCRVVRGGGCGNVSTGRMAKGTIRPCKSGVFTPCKGWPRDNVALGFFVTYLRFEKSLIKAHFLREKID